MSNVIFIRGISGSGKSTLAYTLKEELMEEYVSSIVLEADDYFMKDGVYTFDGELIGKAHEDCVKRMVDNFKKFDVVIVANTFTRAWELENYTLELKKLTDKEPLILRCTGEFENTHGVPKEVVKGMKERFESIEGEVILMPSPTEQVITNIIQLSLSMFD